jgi:murein DD-endopeptidase MepM/ murein hydrolase activator NlpD
LFLNLPDFMKFNRISSTLASVALVTISGFGMSIASLVAPGQQAPAQAQSGSVNTLRGCYQNVAFSGRIAFNPTNIRREPSTSSQIVGQFRQVGETIRFGGITTGSAVNDAWDNKLDNMWYRVDNYRGVSGWAAGAVVNGYPPSATCNVPPSVYTHPLKGAGSVSQGAGGSKSHTGRSANAIDFAAPLGSQVYAMRSGKIVEIQDNFPTWGADNSALGNKANWVVIDHGDGKYSAYMHLQNSSAQKAGAYVGKTVAQGQLIGYVGSSGWSTGPHLHVEVQNGKWGQTVPFSIR